MNKIFLTLVFAFVFLIPVSLFAATKSEVELFKVSVDKIEKNNFYFSPKEIQDNKNIKYWKMRFYCDKEMEIKFENNTKSVCGKAVKFDNAEILPNMFTLENKNTKNKKFSYALKAYNQKGKWMHTSRQNFNWK
jgi:hypothetical protein